MPILVNIVVDCRWPPGPEGRAFRFETRSVAALVTRLIGRRAATAQKLVITCDPEWTGPAFRDVGLGVAEQVVDRQPAELLALRSKEEKRRWVRDVLAEALPLGLPRIGVEPALAHAAITAADEAGLVDQWMWPKARVREGRCFARVFVEHDVDEARLVLRVQDRAGNLLADGPPVRSPPTEFAFVPLLGALTWTSATDVALFDKDGRVVSRLTVPTSTPGG